MSNQSREPRMKNVSMANAARFRVDLIAIILALSGIFILATEYRWENYILYLASMGSVLLASMLSTKRSKRQRD